MTGATTQQVAAYWSKNLGQYVTIPDNEPMTEAELIAAEQEG